MGYVIYKARLKCLSGFLPRLVTNRVGNALKQRRGPTAPRRQAHRARAAYAAASAAARSRLPQQRPERRRARAGAAGDCGQGEERGCQMRSGGSG